MESNVSHREHATRCRELAYHMACPDNREKLRRAAEHWELLAGLRAAGPEPAAFGRTAQARDYLARAAEAEGQAARGTGTFTIQLRGMADLWRGMAHKALLLSRLEQALARGDLDPPAG